MEFIIKLGEWLSGVVGIATPIVIVIWALSYSKDPAGRHIFALAQFFQIIGIGLIAFVSWWFPLILLPAVFYIVLGWGLFKGRSWARTAGVIGCILLLFLFPIGTILGAYGLWVFFKVYPVAASRLAATNPADFP